MFIKKQYLARFGFILSVALASISGSANATTPDGQTPANEGVCNPLQGGTSGLYGLCVAYCEAQDLNTLDKNPPSLRILANYNKKKQASDIDMPCVSPQYSCFNQDELDSIITTNQCQRYTDNSGSVIQHGVQGGSLNDHFVKVDTRAAASCVYVDVTVTPNIVRTQFTVDATQAQAAHDAINNKCKNLGL
ncbi:MAG: hypothetical protein KAT90_13810 [Gammaproteobacteria bacterium]|nr:hypothetical protein [Gammaproteobacteria bacterium]